MAKKQLTFAEKAARSKKKGDWKYIKYVKSVRSEKTGHWRFNEQMIRLNGGETLDAALKRMDDETRLIDFKMPVVHAQIKESPTKSEVQADKGKSEKQVTPIEKDKPAKESVTEENIATTESTQTGGDLVVETSSDSE